MKKQNWKNRTLFHGDNLEFMRAMNSETVDLIATDPPFNKGRDFHANKGPESLVHGASFQDRWSWIDDVQLNWLDKIADDFPQVLSLITGVKSSYGDDMAAYLCFLGIRLLEMQRLLKPSGSIYLHCDHTASHYIKYLMDSIFGKENFRNEIVWCYTGPGNAKRDFPRKHDSILHYTIGNSWTFNNNTIQSPLTEKDNNLRNEDFVEDAGETKNKFISKQEIILESWWPEAKGNGFSPVGRLVKERTGYPTQKPLALYERIISVSSNAGDVVLDPFCGCATTLLASERLRRQWIGIDLWDRVYEVAKKRFKNDGVISSRVCINSYNGNYSICDDLTYSEIVPKRTDDGIIANPEIKSCKKNRHTNMDYLGPTMVRSQIFQELIDLYGMICLGCDRKFDDIRYLHIAHDNPRIYGGTNHISNRILLCGPCKIEKKDEKSLSMLRKYNKENGHMAKTPHLPIALTKLVK